MTYTTTMTSKGQITVPAPIRKKLGLQPGTAIDIKLRGNTAIVEANDWKKGLAEWGDWMEAYRKKHNIKPLSDSGLRKLKEEAGRHMAQERHERYLRSLED
jgi:AbrB family looped-hinge helix DNA binding protein